VVVHILRVYRALQGRLRLCTSVQPYCPALPLFTLLYFLNINTSKFKSLNSLAFSSLFISITSLAASASLLWSAKLEKKVGTTVVSGGPTDVEIDECSGDDVEDGDAVVVV
jgi:hypothetical protein